MENKNTAAFMSSAETDERQPNFESNNIITEISTNGNSEDEYSRSMLMREIDPYYLYTVPMTQLFDNIYGSKQPIIDNFLFAGTYLFAGAPKIGKSFFMAQLMVGKGSQRHNNRDFVAENVDAERTPNNITYCNENISNNELKSQLWDYRMEKSKMEVELRKFDKIKKYFGAETIRHWLDEIKKSKQRKKTRTEEER